MSNNKKTVLIKVSYLVDMEDEDLSKVDGLLDKITSEVSEDINLQLNTNEMISLKWEGTSSRVLDSERINCGKCANCNGWVTDIEKEDPIKELCYGATVDGKLLCDECLPPEHPCAF
ncbi:hypothetical protein [Cellulosilyticum sp. WCF-2]|uniref:hypothetical protein n=1 Tax=Cellulosilyticum sp. WCF-2 TaxID=2497860 RepID=UPI000F8F0836|nr:hypothetical protein [Cellulosilyticum sp. WCF-2]QEH67703.1 hypothetical protein EKH84_04550 [Cellulosilyticum sp. WCF-2]